MQQIISPSKALEIVRDEKETIAYDTETTGLDVTSQAVGYVITNRDYSVYVPVRHEPGGNIPDGADFESELAAAFKERSRLGFRTVGHNLGFDLRVSLRHGIQLGSPLEDTMINEGLISDITQGYGLDDCSARYGVTLKKGDELYREIASRFGGLPDRSSMANFWRMPGDHPLVVEYATGDGVSTLELWEKQQRLLDEEGLRIPWKLECDLLPYVARVHNRGIKVNLDQRDKLIGNNGEIHKAIKEARTAFPAGFNVRSQAEVEKLYRANGYGDLDFAYTAPTKSKPNGAVSFTEKWLSQNEIGRAILKIRQLEACISKFIVPMTETNLVNGRLHPVLNQSKSDEYGAIGARFSCSGPNLQAVTKRNKEMGKIVRSVVEADEGMEMGEADFSQQEPRFFTHYAEEEVLIKGYATNEYDIHDVASSLLNLERDTAKRLGLGMLTGMSPKALSGHMNWPLGRAKEAHSQFLGAFPGIRQFQADAISVFEHRGYVKSILGRRARLESHRFAYRAISRIIQNSGGDHMKSAFLLANQFEDAYPEAIQILLTIHDSNVFQFDPAHRKRVREMVDALDQVASNPPFNLIVPIPTELVVGKTWADASYGPKVKSVKGGWVDGWR